MFSSNTTQIGSTAIAAPASFSIRTDLTVLGFNTAYDSVAYGTDTALAVGSGGVILKTVDAGVTWTYIPNLSLTDWGVSNIRGIAYSGSLFVVVGDSGKVATSTDGVTWTYQTGLTVTAFGTNDVNTITWSGSQFVAGGAMGAIATSSDGVTWVYRNSLSTGTWGSANVNKVLFANSLFVAVGDSGKVATSTDGITWTYQSGLSSTAWGTSSVRAIIWSNSVYAVVGDGGKFATSANGAAWTNSTALSSSAWSTTNGYSISSNGTFWLAGGSDGMLAISINAGSTWVGINNLVTNMSGRIWRTSAWVQSNRVALPDVVNNLYGDSIESNTALSWTSNLSTANSGLSYTNYTASNLAGYSIAHGNKYVAVGSLGRVMTSTDGIYWTYQPQLQSTAWGTRDIYAIYSDGTTYAIGGAGGGIATSTDGITWTYKSGLSATAWGTSNAVRTITKNATTTWLVGGDNGAIAITSNFTSWTYSATLTTAFSGGYVFRSLYHSSNAIFVVFGNDSSGASRVATTTSGTAWTLRSYPANSMDLYNVVVATNGSTMIAATMNSHMVKSVNGSTWTVVSAGSFGTPQALTWDGSRFLLASSGSSGSNVLSYNTDGTTGSSWSASDSTFMSNIGNSVGFAKGTDEILSFSDTGFIASVPVASPHTSAWTARRNSQLTFIRTLSATVDAIAANYVNGAFWLLGANGRLVSISNTIYRFLPGLLGTTWGTSSVRGITWDGSQYLVFGDSGKIATSTDGITWTPRTNLSTTGWSTSAIYNVIWNGSQYLAIGDSGKTATSTDGITWTYTGANLISTSWGSSNIRDAIWLNNQYIIVGFNGAVATSADGATWTYQGALASSSWGVDSVLAIASNGTILLVGGVNGKTAISTDGVSWSYTTSLSGTSWGAQQVNDLVWTGTQFVAVGTNGALAYSVNGTNWTFSNVLQVSSWGVTNVNGIGNTSNNLALAGSTSKSAIST